MKGCNCQLESSREPEARSDMLLLALTPTGFAPTVLPSLRSIALPGFAQPTFPPLRSFALPRCAQPPRLLTEADTATRTGDTPIAGLESDRVRTVCVALLGQLSKIEDEARDEELDFSGFSDLVDELKVQCDEEDKRSIFAMVDADGSGTIDANEIKSAVRNSGAITSMYQESVATFGTLIAATLAFDAGILFFKGPGAAFDFLAAYFVEDSLSVDNLFVFLLLFRYFQVPPQLVDICLNYGITGSIVLRGIFIFAGLAAVSAFKPILLGFAGFLIYSSYSMLAGGDEDDDEDDAPPELVGDRPTAAPRRPALRRRAATAPPPRRHPAAIPPRAPSPPRRL